MVGTKVIENLQILFGVTGQSLVFDAPEGRPDSVTTSAVFENIDSDDASSPAALTGSASIETSPDTTIDAASGFGEASPRTINVAATTGVVIGRRYLLTGAAGETEWTEAREIVSGASLLARKPLRNAYVSADTFQSTRISHAIDATWVADINGISSDLPAPRYRWRIEYVFNSVTYIHHAFFDLVRYSCTPTVTGLDVDRAYPWISWMESLPTYDREDGGANIIKEACRQVSLHLAAAEKSTYAARNSEVMNDLIIHRAASLAIGKDIEALEVIERNYQATFNNFITTTKPALPFDSEGTGAAAPAKSSRVFRR